MEFEDGGITDGRKSGEGVEPSDPKCSTPPQFFFLCFGMCNERMRPHHQPHRPQSCFYPPHSCPFLLRSSSLPARARVSPEVMPFVLFSPTPIVYVRVTPPSSHSTSPLAIPEGSMPSLVFLPSSCICNRRMPRKHQLARGDALSAVRLSPHCACKSDATVLTSFLSFASNLPRRPEMVAVFHVAPLHTLRRFLGALRVCALLRGGALSHVLEDIFNVERHPLSITCRTRVT